MDSVHEVCDEVKNLLAKKGFRLPSFTPENYAPVGAASCRNSVALLTRCDEGLLNSCVPIKTTGDGNCLFRAVSYCLFRTESAHLALRALVSIEIGLHKYLYSATSSRRLAPLNDQLIIIPSYEDLMKELTTPGTYSDIVAILGLSSVLNVAIKLHFPSGLSESNPLAGTFVGRKAYTEGIVSLMWSSSRKVPKAGAIEVDHFVPLLCRQPSQNNLYIGKRKRTSTADKPASNEERKEKRKRLLTSQEATEQIKTLPTLDEIREIRIRKLSTPTCRQFPSPKPNDQQDAVATRAE